jgi:putative flippase GtrA
MIRKAWSNEKFRYLLIGAYNTAVGYGVFALLWMLWGQSLHYIVILALSHIIAVTNAFFGYRIFVFRKRGTVWGDFFRFNLVYLGAFVLNIMALPILIDGLNFHPLLAQGLVVIVTVVISYILHRRFSFRVAENPMFKNHNWKVLLLTVSLIILSIVAMLAWRSMPIFPDEIAVRWIAGRYIQDNGISQKLFHYCSGNTRETPVLFVLPALIFSWLDLFFSPVDFRIFPFLITISAIGLAIFLAVRKGAPYAAVIATTAFLGVAGSGLIMARSEYIQVLNIACCLGAFYFIESGSKLASLRYGLIIILMISVLMSLYSHIQGLLFLPLTLFMIFQLLGSTLGKNITAMMLIVLLFFVAYITITFSKFSCAEHPEIVQYTMDKVFNLEQFKILGVGNWLGFEIHKYYLSFLYKDYYQINYLPGIVTNNFFQQILLNTLNFGIVIILLFNFGLFLYVAVIGSVFLVKRIWQRAGSLLASSESNPSVETVLTLMMVVMPVLFLFFYDSDRNFYRSFFINLLIAIVLAIVISRKLETRVPVFVKFYFGLCGLTVLASVIVNFWWFTDKLDAGFEGPSIAIKQDWKGIGQEVEKLAEACGMNLAKGRIVVDDMTFDSLKIYPYLYPISYLNLSAILTGVKPITVIDAIKPNYIIVRCGFRSLGLDFQQSRNQLCCQNLSLIEHKINE